MAKSVVSWKSHYEILKTPTRSFRRVEDDPNALENVTLGTTGIFFIQTVVPYLRFDVSGVHLRGATTGTEVQ